MDKKLFRQQMLTAIQKGSKEDLKKLVHQDQRVENVDYSKLSDKTLLELAKYRTTSYPYIDVTKLSDEALQECIDAKIKD